MTQSRKRQRRQGGVAAAAQVAALLLLLGVGPACVHAQVRLASTSVMGVEGEGTTRDLLLPLHALHSGCWLTSSPGHAI